MARPYPALVSVDSVRVYRMALVAAGAGVVRPGLPLRAVVLRVRAARHSSITDLGAVDIWRRAGCSDAIRWAVTATIPFPPARGRLPIVSDFGDLRKREQLGNPDSDRGHPLAGVGRRLSGTGTEAALSSAATPGRSEPDPAVHRRGARRQPNHFATRCAADGARRRPGRASRRRARRLPSAPSTSARPLRSGLHQPRRAPEELQAQEVPRDLAARTARRTRW